MTATPNPFVRRVRPRRLRVINKTHWRTDHIRAFVNRVAQEELDPEKRKGYVVYIEYAHGHGFSSGHAPYGGNHITVRLSSGNNGKLPSKTDFAGVIAHEMAHTRGMHHWQMQGDRYQRGHGEQLERYKARYAWAEELPLEKKSVRAKTADIQEVRHTRTLESIKRWESKLKRAQTALKKLRAQDRYYTKALAAKAASKPPNQGDIQ